MIGWRAYTRCTHPVRKAYSCIMTDAIVNRVNKVTFIETEVEGMDNSFPVLCGGTFFTLLLLARKQRTSKRTGLNGEKDGLANYDILHDLLSIVSDEIYEPKGFESTITSKYKSCTGKITDLLEEPTVEHFKRRVADEYMSIRKDMENFVNKKLSLNSKSGKHTKLVKALLELIELDQSINSDAEFNVLPNGKPMTRAEMSNTLNKPLDIYMPSFLLGIWHFIIANKIDNTLGAATYRSWHEKPPDKPNAEGKFVSKIGENYKRPLNISIELPSDYGNKTKTASVFQSEPTVDELIENELPAAISKKTIPPGSHAERVFVMNKDSYAKTEHDGYSEIKAVMDGQVSQATKDSMCNIVDDKILPELREKLREPMLHIYDLIENQAYERDKDVFKLKSFIHFIDSEILNGPASLMMRLSEHGVYDSLLRLRELVEDYSRNASLSSAFGSICYEPAYYTRFQKEFEALVMEIFSEDDDA